MREQLMATRTLWISICDVVFDESGVGLADDSIRWSVATTDWKSQAFRQRWQQHPFLVREQSRPFVEVVQTEFGQSMAIVVMKIGW